MRLFNLVLVFSFLSSIACAHNLKGKWTTDCSPYGKHASISNVTFEETEFYSTGFLYEKKGCAISTVKAQMNGHYKVGLKNEFDYTPHKFTLSLLKPEVVSHYNKNNICNYSDWELNVPKDILGRKNCVGLEPPEKDIEIYDIYNLKSKSDLKFAIFPVGTSVTDPHQRPTAIADSALQFWSVSEAHLNRVERDLSIYDEHIKQKRTEFAKTPQDIHSKNWIKANLAFMVEIDQYMRTYIHTPYTMEYSKIENTYFQKQFAQRFNEMDQTNTTELKRLLTVYDWFTISNFGMEADNNAWLLAQHADHDPDFQKKVLQILTKLWKSGETNARNYAYLFDRVAASFNDPTKRVPQRYGTQGSCTGPQKWQPIEIEDPDNVDKRRREVGLEPLANYIEIFKDICK